MKQSTFVVLSVMITFSSSAKVDQKTKKTKTFADEELEKKSRVDSKDVHKMISKAKTVLAKELEVYCKDKLQVLPRLNKRLVMLKMKGNKTEAKRIEKIIKKLNMEMPFLLELIKAREDILEEQQQYIEDKGTVEGLKAAIVELDRAKANIKIRKPILVNKEDDERCQKSEKTKIKNGWAVISKYAKVWGSS